MKNDTKFLAKITIITVVYNAKQELEKTIESVINQTYKNVEYIIVDGGSNDGSVDIVRSYDDSITCWVSEPDEGIYDAMNKGAQLATGDVVNFMNAGDTFITDTTLEKVAEQITTQDKKLYVGGHVVLYPDGASKSIFSKIIGNKTNFYKMPVCHQAMFAPLELLTKHKFNINYKIAADFDFFLSSINDNVYIHELEQVIAQVTSGGVSDIERVKTWREYEQIHANHTGTNLWGTIYYIYHRSLERVKLFVKRLFRINSVQN